MGCTCISILLGVLEELEHIVADDDAGPVAISFISMGTSDGVNARTCG